MSNYRVLLFVAIIVAIICQTCIDAGPARSFAAVVSSRAAKIPRSIRAPFRNTEMMTARGFGKRSQLPGKTKNFGETFWGTGKGKYLDGLNALEAGDIFDPTPNDAIVESFPIDWLANELADNPVLAQAILHRFVDANHDGTVSAQELTGMGAPEANENNF